MNDEVLRIEEAHAIAQAILDEIDQPRSRRDAPPKTILADFMGTPKSGKDTTLRKIEQFFRREGFRVFTPAEGAEIEEIRAFPSDQAFALQARHLAYSLSTLLDFARSRNFHLVIPNRGILDHLAWWKLRVHRGEITEQQEKYMRDFILSGEWMDAIDAFFVLTCREDVALKREYQGALTEKLGSKMNREFLAAMLELYQGVMDDLRERFPDLPLFHIDTSDMTEVETGRSALSLLLQSVQQRLALGEEKVLPRSLPLLRHHALRADQRKYAQLKFRGRRDWGILRKCAWHLAARTFQEDLYLRPRAPLELYPGETLLIRKEGDQYCFTYKGTSLTDAAAVRPELILPLLKDDKPRLSAAYQEIAQVKKSREIYIQGDFVLMSDMAEELGEFTEFHATDADKLPKLWELAQELGFGEEDLVRESYLELALRSKGVNA